MMAHAVELYVDTPQLGALTRPVRVLIVDYCDFDRLRLRKLIQDYEQPVEIAELDRLCELDRALDQVTFDVILIDYQLPVGTGLDAVQTIRTHPLNADCPTLMIAGDDRPEISEMARVEGCRDFLHKDGLTADRLCTALRSAVSQTQDLNAFSTKSGRRLEHDISQLVHEMRNRPVDSKRAALKSWKTAQIIALWAELETDKITKVRPQLRPS
ncbi:MAG: response regulator [Paracoccaceae bacterium]|nr:response regulator [Paracoccaceae bacterium]